MAMRFSDRYIPGAINDQAWNSRKGIATTTDSTSVSLNGVKNGEATSVAIMLEPTGSRERSGSDTNE